MMDLSRAALRPNSPLFTISIQGGKKTRCYDLSHGLPLLKLIGA